MPAGPTCRTRRWPPTRADWLAPHLAGMARLADAGAAGPGRACCAALLAWALARAAGPRSADAIWRCRAAARRSTTPQPVPVAVGPRAGVLRAGRDAAAGRRARAAAAGAAVAGGAPVAITADLAGFWRGALGRCAARHARALPEARLAGKRRPADRHSGTALPGQDRRRRHSVSPATKRGTTPGWARLLHGRSHAMTLAARSAFRAAAGVPYRP